MAGVWCKTAGAEKSRIETRSEFGDSSLIIWRPLRSLIIPGAILQGQNRPTGPLLPELSPHWVVAGSFSFRGQYSAANISAASPPVAHVERHLLRVPVMKVLTFFSIHEMKSDGVYQERSRFRKFKKENGLSEPLRIKDKDSSISHTQGPLAEKGVLVWLSLSCEAPTIN